MWILSVAWECPVNYYGGLGTVVSRLLPALSDLGHPVVHLCTSDSTGCRRYGGTLYCSLRTTVAPGGLLDKGELVALSSQCLDLVEGFDAVLAHDFHSAGCVWLAREHGVRVAFFVHSVGDPYTTASACEAADVVVANSRKTESAVAALARPKRTKVVYFPPPYPPAERREPFRRSTRILILTRYQWNKDPGWVLEILSEIWRRRGGFTVTLAGRGVELYGYEYPFLRVVGSVSEEEKVRLITSHDLLVYPSRDEPYGMVPLESVALGTPALVSSGAGVAEVLTEGILDCGDEGKAKETLESYIGDPQALAELLERQRRLPIVSKPWADVAAEVLSSV